jgi:hypothetical protein
VECRLSACDGQVWSWLECDSLAGEVFELAGQFALASLLGDPGVVVAGAEVVVAGARVGQDVPDDREDGVADRDDGAFLAAAAGQAVAVAEEGVGVPGDDLIEGAGEPRVAFAGGGGIGAAGGLLSIGADLAQDTRCAAVGNTVMVTAISATSSCAERCPMPGISSNLSTASMNGAISSSMRASRGGDVGGDGVDPAQRSSTDSSARSMPDGALPAEIRTVAA